MSENSSFQDLFDSDGINNSTTIKDYRPSVAMVVLTTTAIVTLMLNVTCFAVCIKTLQNKFQNLVVLALSFSDSTMSLGMLTMILSNLVSSTGHTSIELCLFQLIMVFYGVSTTYSLILLLCLQRYYTVKSFNFGTNEHLNKKKFGYVGGTLLLSFLYSTAMTLLTPHKSRIDHCSSKEIYGEKNYFYYNLLSASCLTLLVILVFSLTTLTGVRLWRTFFKHKNKITPVTGNSNTTGNHKISRSDFNFSATMERPGTSTRLALNHSRSNSCSPVEAEQVRGKKRVQARRKTLKRDRKSDYELGGETNAVIFLAHDVTNEEQIHGESQSIASPSKIKFFVEIDIASECNDSFNKRLSVNVNPNPAQTLNDLRKNDTDDKSKKVADVIKSTKPVIAWDDILSISKHDAEFTSETESVSSLPSVNNYSKKTKIGCIQRHTSVKSTMTSTIDDNKSLVKQRLAWETRAFITCLLLAISTIIFTCPMIVMLYVNLSGYLVSDIAKSYGFLPLMVNSFLNPFVYAWRVPEIKVELKRILRINQ